MKPFILLISVMLVTGCASVRNAPGTQETDHFIVDGKLFTAVWQQHAAEYKALCLQAFNTATLRLDEYLQQDTSQKPPAVITDIDETFLDNSPYAIRQALQGKDYEPSSWGNG
jgi:5'-nucleotidase (lipoprotein e(P4) family)